MEKQHIEREIAQLKAKLAEMSDIASQVLSSSISAIAENNKDLALKAIDEDKKLDRMNVEIDQESVYLLAQAPLAADLRLIVMSMKIAQNLERIGDESSKIARSVINIADSPRSYFLGQIQQLGGMVLNMLKSAMQSFHNRDLNLAFDTISRDAEIDAFYKQIRRDIEEHMLKNKDNIHTDLVLVNVIKRLERIADHTTNIAEEIIYIYEARDIRYTPPPSNITHE